eukprot:1129418-Pelagomonas_calceolata.AAC.1
MEARPAPRGPLLTPLRRILLTIMWCSVTTGMAYLAWWSVYILKEYEEHCLAPHRGDIVGWWTF